MPLLSDDEIEARLGERAGWERRGNAIEREFDRGDFMGSIDLVNRIAPVAEDMGHHPDLEISWSTVRVSLSTHSESGLTENDFELAARIDGLA
jgi:4a-hydroxytetrahydrobiopterin dehydratase